MSPVPAQDRSHPFAVVCREGVNECASGCYEEGVVWGDAAVLRAEDGGEDLALRKARGLWLRGQPLAERSWGSSRAVPSACYSPVQEEDEQKRLLVTVWNRERNSR